MNNKKEIKNGFFTGERSLFGKNSLAIYNTIFADGESPLKESENIDLEVCMFKWKYPLWYSNNVKLKNCTFFETARSGIWYTNNIQIEDSVIEAPKTFRYANKISLNNVTIPNAFETLWKCKNICMDTVKAKGDYFGMNSQDILINNLTLTGNYSFDSSKNIEIRNSKLISKDAFWNCENVTVYNSFISGEYLGWNSKNITFINCTIESLQGLCYIENLTMKNCKLLNTTLAFEYSTIEVDIIGKIDSVLNPKSGSIVVYEIGKLILEPSKTDIEKLEIVYRKDKIRKTI